MECRFDALRLMAGRFEPVGLPGAETCRKSSDLSVFPYHFLSLTIYGPCSAAIGEEPYWPTKELSSENAHTVAQKNSAWRLQRVSALPILKRRQESGIIRTRRVSEFSE